MVAMAVVHTTRKVAVAGGRAAGRGGGRPNAAVVAVGAVVGAAEIEGGREGSAAAVGMGMIRSVRGGMVGVLGGRMGKRQRRNAAAGTGSGSRFMFDAEQVISSVCTDYQSTPFIVCVGCRWGQRHPQGASPRLQRRTSVCCRKLSRGAAPLLYICEREYCTAVSAANTDPSVSCVRPVCACCGALVVGSSVVYMV
jgi:hypothetical protein